MPKLSIITVNLNNAKGLQKTIESVISQTFTDYEYIIIDGGSTDGSKEIIEEYADKITYWVSEPDKGIYNGMNKGIKVAKGEYCLFLNSGDWLMKKNSLFKLINNETSEDIVFANIFLDNNTTQGYPENPSFLFVLINSLPHQASLIKRRLFNTIGLYNENVKVVSDWEFFIKSLFIHNCSYKHYNYTFAGIETIGVSSMDYCRNWKEKRVLIKKNFPHLSELIIKYIDMEKELSAYNNSKLINIVKKIQNYKIYKFFISK